MLLRSPTLLSKLCLAGSSFPFQLRTGTSVGQPSPHPNLTGTGSQPCPSHEGRSGAVTLLPGPCSRGESCGYGGLRVTPVGTPVYAQPALRTLSAGGGELPRVG